MSSFLEPLWWLNRQLLLCFSSLRGVSPALLAINVAVNCLVSGFRLVFPSCTAYVLYTFYLLATASPCLLYPRLPPFITSRFSFLFSSSHPAIPLHLHPLLHMVLLLSSVVEVGFFFFLWHRSRVLQRRRAPPPLSKEYREVFIRRVLIAICKVAAEDERSSLVGDDRMIARAKKNSPRIQPPPPSSLNLANSTPVPATSSSSLPLPPSTVLPPPGPLLPTPPHRLQRLSLSGGSFDVRKILQGWFYNAPVEDIWEGNVIQWLCHGLFHRDWSEMSEAQHEEMLELWGFLKAGGRSKEELERARAEEENRLFYPSRPGIDRAASVAVLPLDEAPAPPMQRAFSDAMVELPSGLPLPSRVVIHPGFNRRTQCMRVIIDPIRYQHRPLFLYGLVAGLHWLYSAYLSSIGYCHYRSASLEYFHRPPMDPSAAVRPTLVFVHGISNGLSSYHTFVSRLSDSGNRHVVLLVLPFISMRIEEHVPTAKDTVEALRDALVTHTAPAGSDRPPRFILIGHSYGSLVASWFIKAYPSLLLSVVLIDPVCFLLFLPHLCYNFLYRQPISPMHHILSFFAAKELFISHTLHRHFFWTVNVLWVEDLTHIGEDEEPTRERDRQQQRQKAENWRGTESPPPPPAPTNGVNGHSAFSTPQKRKKARPIRGIASSRASPEPELVLNAAISPLLRAPRVIARLPSPSKHPPQPSKCYVFLSEQDDLIYAPAVHSYLTGGRRELMEAQVETQWREQQRSTGQREGKDELVARLSELLCNLTMWKKFRHAQFLTSAKRQCQVMESIIAAEGMADV